MARQVLRLNNFSGGLSDDDKFGPANSFSEGQGIDFRKSPGILTLQKEMFAESDESGTIIVTEVTDAARVRTGDIYFAGGNKVYKRAVSTNAGIGTYSVALSNANFFGLRDLDYRPELDTLFMYDPKVIHTYSPLSTSPSLTVQRFYNYLFLDQSGNSGGAYTIPTSLTEADQLSFTAIKEPFDSMIFKLVTKTGSPTLTFTVHDKDNNVVATPTVSSGSLTAGNDFGVAPAIQAILTPLTRMALGNAYHVHVHSSVAGNTIQTTAANTLQTAYCKLYASRLVPPTTVSPTYTGMNPHPYGHRTIQSGAKTYICNERYLAEWEILNTAANNTDGYNPHRLTFPANFITNGVAEYNEYLAISCAVQDGSDSQDSKGSSGYIFLWDKSSTFYNVAIPIPEGVPNGLFSFGNMIYWEVKGRLCRYGGGDIETVYEFPGVDRWQAADVDTPQSEIYLRVPRIAMAARDKLLVIGFPYETANLNTKFGVFSYGHNKGSMPDAVCYDYVPSNGHDYVRFATNTSPDTPMTAITLVKNFGSNLFVASRTKNGATNTYLYNIDYTNDAQGYRAAGSWASLWFDAGNAEKNKTAYAVIITMKPMPTGSTMTPKYRFNRSDTWITATGNAIAQPGDTIVRLTIPTEQSRWREVMVGFDLTNTPDTGEAPQIVSVNFEYDDNEDEEYDAA